MGAQAGQSDSFDGDKANSPLVTQPPLATEMSQYTELPQNLGSSNDDLEEDAIVVAAARARYDSARGRSAPPTSYQPTSALQSHAPPTLPNTTSALPTLDSLTIETSNQSNAGIPRARNSGMLYHHWIGVGALETASRWSAESPAVRQHFERLAEEEKTRHQATYPYYQYHQRRLRVVKEHGERVSLTDTDTGAGTTAGDTTSAYNTSVRTGIPADGGQEAEEKKFKVDMSNVSSPSPEKFTNKIEQVANNKATNNNVSSRRPKKRVRFSSPEVMAAPRIQRRADKREELLARLSTPIKDAMKAQPQDTGDEDDNSEDEDEEQDDISNREAKYVDRHNSPTHRAARMERETDLAMPTSSRGPGSSPRKYKSVIRSFINRGAGTSVYLHTEAEYEEMPHATPRQLAAYRSHDNPKPRLTFAGFPTMEVPGGYYSPGVDAYWESYQAKQALKALRGEGAAKTYVQEEKPLLWTMYLTKNDLGHYFDEAEDGDGENKE